MTEIAIRPARAEDLETLWDYLAMAAYEPDAAAAKADPLVAVYLDGWPRNGDFGFIAEHNGWPAGAAWARHFPRTDDPSIFHAENTPELSIGVAPHLRGLGLGWSLLLRVTEEAARRGSGLCLNVRTTNPARRLYERIGFRPVPGMTVSNRVGGQSVWMRWTPAEQ